MHHNQPNTSRAPMPGHPLTTRPAPNLVELIRRDPRAARGLDTRHHRAGK